MCVLLGVLHSEDHSKNLTNKVRTFRLVFTTTNVCFGFKLVLRLTCGSTEVRVEVRA